MISLLFIGCQKDSQMPAPQASPDQQEKVDPAQLIFNPGSIEFLSHDMPQFNLAHFKATHKPINVFDKYDVAEEDREDLKMISAEELMAAHPSRAISWLPSGSVDGLAAAIASAGPNGLVIVASGMHYESARVVISDRVTIVGMPGAVIETTTSDWMPAIHIKNAYKVSIIGLEMRVDPEEVLANTYAILIENSDKTTLLGNTILGYDLSVFNEHGNRSVFSLNTIVGTGVSHAFVNANGNNVKVLGNDFSNARFGAWLCDEDGKYRYNTASNSLIGVILCKVPLAYPLPDGGITGSELPGTRWKLKWNDSQNNILVGYLVIDGANNNSIKKSTSAGNGTYEIELVGDSYRFGFYTPPAFDNYVSAYSNQTVKDCGINNTVVGGIPIDIIADPCY
jgi:hypothetical protein